MLRSGEEGASAFAVFNLSWDRLTPKSRFEKMNPSRCLASVNGMFED